LAVDSLTHALVISIIFGVTGRWDLIPFAILGAVTPDIDVVFQRFSDRNPGLYIFTHGGVTHSLAGAVITSIIFSIPGLFVIPAIWPAYLHAGPAPIFGAAMLGALSHVLLDYLAYPGIPLLYPLSDRKYTLGVMGGPNVFLTVGSVAYIALIATGHASSPWPYTVFFIAIILASTGLKAYISRKVEGIAIPAMNPMRWLIMKETPNSLFIYWFSFLKGPANPVAYGKATGLEQGVHYEDSPELRRMRYHSYVVIAGLEGNKITFRDPVRMDGYIWYPPYFKSITVPMKKDMPIGIVDNNI